VQNLTAKHEPLGHAKEKNTASEQKKKEKKPASELSRELLNAFNEGTPKWVGLV